MLIKLYPKSFPHHFTPLPSTICWEKGEGTGQGPDVSPHPAAVCGKSGASRYHLMPCGNADWLHCKAQQPCTKNTLQEPWLTAWSNKIAGDFTPRVIPWRNTEINSIVSLITLIIKSFVTHFLALNWGKKRVFLFGEMLVTTFGSSRVILCCLDCLRAFVEWDFMEHGLKVFTCIWRFPDGICFCWAAQADTKASPFWSVTDR